MVVELRSLINGKWRETKDKKEIKSPYSGEIVGVVARAKPNDVEDAIKAGVEAFKVTKKMPVYERTGILKKIVSSLEAKKESFSKILMYESGKPIKYAREEIDRAINTFTVAMEEAKRIKGEVISLDKVGGSKGKIGIVRRFPIGLILGITPFSSPLDLAAHKLAPAIASGNPIILRPSSSTPLSCLKLAEIAVEAGMCAGTLSVLVCDPRLATIMIADDRIKKVSFAGSSEVGWELKRKYGEKRITLELGGNTGLIVHDDIDLDVAVSKACKGAFSYAGQSCVSVQRIFAHEDIYDNFVDKLFKKTRELKVGDPADERTDVGPMITEKEAKRAEEWVKEAVKMGAKVLTGGKREKNIFEPTVLVDTKPQMKVNAKEVFAPIVTVIPYGDFGEACYLLNQSEYGIQAGIFTNDIHRIFYAFNELDVGAVMVNETPVYENDHMPFSGAKKSGFGREGVQYAIEEMTEPKLLVLSL